MSHLKFMLAIIAALALLSGASLAAERAAPLYLTPNTVIEGTISAIDLYHGSITVANPTKSPVTFFVDSLTKIAKNGQSASLDALTIGDRCRAEVKTATEDGLLALSVQAKTPEVHNVVLEGVISSINLDKRSIVLSGPAGSERPSVVIFATETTKIYKNKQAAPLSALAVGDTCRSEAKPTTEGTFVALNISANTPVAHAIILEGTISAINAENGSITLANPTKEAVTFFVNSTTKIYKNGQLAHLSALVVRDRCRAEARLTDGGKLLALNVQAKSPEAHNIILEGVVSVVDMHNGSVTLVHPNVNDGAPVVFFVTDATKIIKNGQAAVLSALVVGDRCRAEARQTDGGKLVALNVTAKSPEVRNVILEGTISAINAQNGSITLINPTHGTIVFFVNSTTKIYKNSQPATIGMLFIGDKCRAEARQATEGALFALNVKAKSPEVKHQRY